MAILKGSLLLKLSLIKRVDKKFLAKQKRWIYIHLWVNTEKQERNNYEDLKKIVAILNKFVERDVCFMPLVISLNFQNFFILAHRKDNLSFIQLVFIWKSLNLLLLLPSSQFWVNEWNLPPKGNSF